MDADPTVAGAPRADPPPPQVRRLLPAGANVSVGEFVDALALSRRGFEQPARPRVLLNMASTADGRASLGGRSGAIGDRADHALFHALRADVDAVLVGAGTARAERYGPIIRDAAAQRRRAERGLPEQPLACIASASVSLPEDLPLLADAAARVVILTGSQRTLPEAAAQVEYVRAERGGELDLAAALAALHARHGVSTLLCEGGPRLNGGLLRAGLVDELFLSFAPKLAGGEEAGGGQLRIVAGVEFEPPVELELVSALESESQLLLRYGVRASVPEAVSAETIRNSSLAS